ncbi:hypothetical protein HELRODRAFT_109014 [Helobdella robusta]|uniref:Palmitoyltransferase n=1 Tax=Helobdella robusta TaxID=6412 RepID=T1EEQ0_HELRO|nr:hypothetical protein HELRODRAFT_109014 [Helobdella robusta]ESO10617.1 hypothetical protein HELRODRAFT_109014 [Helobdella robusta]
MALNKCFIPRNSGDRISFGLFVVLVHAVAFYELFVILPYIDYERTGTFWFHTAAGLFIYFNVMLSFVQLILIDSSTANQVLPTLLQPGWRYCSQCQTNSPPRSSHCWVCDICVTRRDHHCTFTGNCVGHQNQHYFFSLLIYLLIGAVYCNYLNFDYTFEVLGGLNFTAIFTMVVPMLSWALNFSGAVGFFAAFISATCIISMVLFTVLLIYHGRNLLCGQTCIERSSSIHEYDLGSWKRNVESLLGERWLAVLLFPALKYQQTSGLEFKTHLVKQM